MKERIFSLDIGTRTVVGTILEKKAEKYQVIDYCSVEHNERSMVDGQIHDVVSVAKIIQSVKEQLERNHGPLHKVCVAAAGRALKTKKIEVQHDITKYPLLNEEDVTHLELSAVQQAQYELATEEQETNSTHYYCVGYSVLHFTLDHEEIVSLIDQRGDTASVEIIATFLPKVVVESLLAALKRASLEMEALTLEPIAAINVLIPPTMRRLNVALVDIGAGTSDIAITEHGTVTAYGMVPIAGDEITEALSDQYLLDFPLAEKAKRQLTEEHSITVTDILGFETEVSYDEAITSIEESIEKLSSAIRDELLRLNARAPKAVMLVGGGSLTPNLTKSLATKLSLPENRVAIRGVDAIAALQVSDNVPIGPEFVTPIGIAIASQQSPVHYISVQVNERVIRLFDMKSLTVGDCLLAAGIKMNKLYGRPGTAYFIQMNGSEMTLPGQFGDAPIILCNDKPCSLQDSIKQGDQITVERGTDGLAPTVTIEDLVGDLPVISVIWNDTSYEVKPTITVNGSIAQPNYVIQDNDKIQWNTLSTIGDFFTAIDEQRIVEQCTPVTVYVNEQQYELPYSLIELKRNGILVKMETPICNNDVLETSSHHALTVSSLLNTLQETLTYSIPVSFNGEMVTLSKPKAELRRNGVLLEENSILHHRDYLTMTEFPMEPFIFQDIFRFVDVHLDNTSGRSYQLFKNGKEATFLESLAPGDKLELRWSTNHALMQ
ncbi:cell division protein FtsA [Pontibacillus litoralis]|uniref:Cell division protein n=1 Tax=Pontibacillus litoralis JSM 072002 TaxID=1385512 RepID=A0A0A5HZW1_9BACI|nr:cell division protein FtsA [Pontibacillus litoralis]KGX89147.1 cell division protein [Pontibacillus litoralis JSM 072002]